MGHLARMQTLLEPTLRGVRVCTNEKAEVMNISYLSIWLLAVLGSPTIQTLMSPLRLVFSIVTLGTPPNNMRSTPRLTSSFPENKQQHLIVSLMQETMKILIEGVMTMHIRENKRYAVCKNK